MTILSVGLYVVDLYARTARLPGPGESVEALDYDEHDGGKAANQAVAAARLGAPVAFAGRVGDDAVGRRGCSVLEGNGVDTSHFRTVPGRTGHSFIVLDAGGLQQIVTWPGAGKQLDATEVAAACTALEPGFILLQGEVPAAVSLSARACAPKATIILDPSPAKAFVGVDLSTVDIVTPNRPEAELLAGPAATAARIAEVTGAATVALTHGADGVELWHEGRTRHVPAPVVEVVDTTGAGDAFNGALAADLHAGAATVEAVRRATRAAAFATTIRGCIPSYPTPPELEEL